jgi:hypothetical protein
MSITNSSLGGSTIKGISPKQTITNYRSNDQVRLRRIVTKSWNTAYATGTVNGRNRAIGGFRAVSNSGDFLSRDTYNCGGIAESRVFEPGLRGRFGYMFQNCDGTNIPPSSCNVKFVPDSSDYVTYKKQRAVNVLYNDSTFGGDQSNASYGNIMHVRRGI